MAVINVACPYCHRETLASIPEGASLKQVRKEKEVDGFRTMASFGLLSPKEPSNFVEAACDEGHQFYVYYEK